MKSISLLLLILCLGCTEPLVLEIDPATVTIDFSVASVSLDQPRIGEVRGAAGEIILRFSFDSGNLGYRFRPSLTRLPTRGYRLSVVAEFDQGVWPSLTHYQYQATLRELPPGRYPLTVVHRIPSERRDTTVFNGTVDVR